MKKKKKKRVRKGLLSKLFEGEMGGPQPKGEDEERTGSIQGPPGNQGDGLLSCDGPEGIGGDSSLSDSGHGRFQKGPNGED